MANIYDQNYGEVQDYLTISNHLYTGGTMTVNNSWLLEQSEEVRQAIYESVKIGEAYTAIETLRVEGGLLEELGKMMEIYQLSPEEFKQFQDISKQTWDQAAQRIGKEYFEKVRVSIERTLASM